jgi:hypothetical protein
MIDDDGGDDRYRKKDEIDEEFHCSVLSNEPDERHEGISDEAKELLCSKEKDMIDDAAVVPKRTPYIP